MLVRGRKKGQGLVNSLINKLPIELHLPGYQYCGPGTKLAKRLSRGDPGINPLDTACKQHDIAYANNSEDLTARHRADYNLEQAAKQRVFAKDAKLGEKVAAWSVAEIMNAKRKLGMGLKASNRKNITKSKRRKTSKRKILKQITLKKVIDGAKIAMHQSPENAVKAALTGARAVLKKIGGKKYVKVPKVLPISTKVGGFLPLIPLFAGLSAIGGLAGGAAGIAKAVNDAKAAQRSLEEKKRHNTAMEEIAINRGMHMKPHKTGLGLHLTPYAKNM